MIDELICVNVTFPIAPHNGAMERVARSIIYLQAHAARAAWAAVVSLLAITAVAVASLEAHPGFRSDPSFASAASVTVVPRHDCGLPVISDSADCQLPTAAGANEEVAIPSPIRAVAKHWFPSGGSGRMQYRPSGLLRPPPRFSASLETVKPMLIA